MDYLDSTVITDGKEGNLSERLKIAEKCSKIKIEFDELEKNVEAVRGKMRNKGGSCFTICFGGSLVGSLYFISSNSSSILTSLFFLFDIFFSFSCYFF